VAAVKLDLLQMSRDEKLRAMHELWEDLARDDEALPSPGWHEQALRETADRVRDGQEGVREWADAKDELRRRRS
jgi:hypothetical protein